MAARHLVITGRVQGVGWRDWMAGQARTLGLNGWVRNRADGSVEALIDGPEPAVEEMLRACRSGPRLAVVSGIVETLAEPPAEHGFQLLPNA
ncbi:MAG: acylphosphatase [Rhodospirillales bacterium 70-18]|nr:acylphosphatase [Rhodospirillales bacterium]OJY76277.1 MAG: acylphosphatase [Rhodospirillales bacterium 70-18]